MKIYAVIDHKAKSIVSIFQGINDEAAERSFLMLLTSPGNIFSNFAEDFSLYPIAELSVDGSRVKVARQGLEHVHSNGFTVDMFNIDDPIKRGVDYDKRYLRMVMADRFDSIPGNDDKEVSEDGE